ncbi:hypothetical protein TH25_03320 [Thalassospira profundimaris]|uniref:Uncharacterized protein n=1 Tax=Thalassospira profundimaris TaxID=502049 RepID=A0A367XIT3_9PROT|nr:hypothetical protein [Thalassospira profundimaris]RCK53567.1 hypothetical protein TH25_03320 [Thalassospira profundimaris]
MFYRSAIKPSHTTAQKFNPGLVHLPYPARIAASHFHAGCGDNLVAKRHGKYWNNRFKTVTSSPPKDFSVPLLRRAFLPENSSQMCDHTSCMIAKS